MAAHCSSEYGRVTRGSSRTRVTVLVNSKVTSARSVTPSIGAAELGSGVHARGMWPSPANRPEVGSRPSQPAPGT